MLESYKILVRNIMDGYIIAKFLEITFFFIFFPYLVWWRKNVNSAFLGG